MTGQVFIVVLALIAILVVLAWTLVDHFLYTVPVVEPAPDAGWLFDPTVQLDIVRTGRGQSL